MRRAQRASTTECEWILVTERHPCPMCGAVAGCLRASDAAFASCTRRPSDWRLTNGSWLHRLATLATGSLVLAGPAAAEG
jgi:hypothetical protein